MGGSQWRGYRIRPRFINQLTATPAIGKTRTVSRPRDIVPMNLRPLMGQIMVKDVLVCIN